MDLMPLFFRIGSNELMGCTAIGSSFIGIGREHWLEMLDNPRRPVAQWYPLLESVPGHIAETSVQNLPLTFSCLNGRFVIQSNYYFSNILIFNYIISGERLLKTNKELICEASW